MYFKSLQKVSLLESERDRFTFLEPDFLFELFETSSLFLKWLQIRY